MNEFVALVLFISGCRLVWNLYHQIVADEQAKSTYNFRPPMPTTTTKPPACDVMSTKTCAYCGTKRSRDSKCGNCGAL